MKGIIMPNAARRAAVRTRTSKVPPKPSKVLNAPASEPDPEAIASWLYAEDAYKSDVELWLKAEKAWGDDVWAWLEQQALYDLATVDPKHVRWPRMSHEGHGHAREGEAGKKARAVCRAHYRKVMRDKAIEAYPPPENELAEAHADAS
jgi:hypothetical protein